MHQTALASWEGANPSPDLTTGGFGGGNLHAWAGGVGEGAVQEWEKG